MSLSTYLAMTRLLITLAALCALCGAASALGKLPKDVITTLAMNDFWDRCWGKQNNLNVYLKIRDYIYQCEEMDPHQGFYDNLYANVVSIFFWA